MARKVAPPVGPKLAVVASDSPSPTTIAPFKSQFGGDVQKHLLLYQRFLSQWIMVITSWAGKVAHPLELMSGTRDIYGEVMTSIDTYSSRLFSLAFNRAQQEAYIAMLGQRPNDPVSKVGLAALRRQDALTSAFGLIQVVLEAVNDCFRFGTVLAGGKNASARARFLSSEHLATCRKAYCAALEAMSKAAGSPKVTLAPAKGGKDDGAKLRASAERSILQRLTKAIAYGLIENHLGLSHNVFMTSVQLVCDDSSPPPPPPTDFFKSVPRAMADLDEALAITEVFLGSLFSLTQALRQMNETELADLLEEIAALLK